MKTKPTSLKTQLRDGQLEHVVVVAGKPVQAHSSLPAAICALALAMALSGCTFCREHETACAVAAGVAVVGVGLSFKHGHDTHSGVDGRDYTITPVDCSAGSCK
jgi:hypothetical protein